MNPDISTLIAEARNTIHIIEQNKEFYANFKQVDYPKLGQSTAAAMVFSQIYLDFYTCIETFMFRVSQVFENNLDKEAWHKQLLYKMSLNIESIRPALLSKQSYLPLEELLRFRHFRRYYFSFDYDWDKLTLIDKKYVLAIAHVVIDINKFVEYLHKINK